MGTAIHAEGEPERRRTAPDGSVADAAAEETRAEAYLRIARETFEEAGWLAAVQKTQLGRIIDALGLRVSSVGAGEMSCPPAKRHGLLHELRLQRGPHENGVERGPVETVTGRLTHIAQVAVEGNAFLQPFYAMVNAKQTRTLRGGRKLRVKPSRLTVSGEGPVQRAYQDAVNWWLAALEAGVSVPLAPRRTFPAPGEPGCALTFQDAARGEGTGAGGFVPMVSPVTGQRQLLILAQQWPPDIQAMLVANELSMPAGELFAFAALAATLCHHVAGVTHVIGFTDSEATASAVNSGSSGSPQLQALLHWLYELCPGLQLLAIWLPGKRNTRSDGLSRGVARSFEVVAEAEAGGWQPVGLPLPPGAWEVARGVARLPQRPA